MEKKSLLITIFITIIVALTATGFYRYNNLVKEIDSEPRPVDTETKTVEAEEKEVIQEVVEIYQYSGDLEDVLSKTALIKQRGLLRSGVMSGIAKYRYENEIYDLYVEFENLPTPLNDDFYEGWVVRDTPFAFVSTGKLEEIDGIMTNTFISTNDYSEYNLYVLTIEPNDGNDAPAGHVIEGYMRDKVN